MLEVTELLARGSAAASLRLLWQLHLLDPLFPSLARRFQAAKLPRCARARFGAPAWGCGAPWVACMLGSIGTVGTWGGVVSREPGRAAAQQDLVFEVLEELDRLASLHRPVSAAVLAACLAAPHIAEAAADLRAAEGAHADGAGRRSIAVRTRKLSASA